MTIHELLKENNNITIKVKAFLAKVNEELDSIESIETKDFIVEPEKVSYFNLKTNSIRIYDYKSFNKIFSKNYYEELVKEVIDNSNLFFFCNLGMNTILNISEFNTFQDIFEPQHLVYWFLKALRLNKENSFDLEEVLKKYPFPFLEQNASLKENIDLILKFIELLREKKIISIINNKIVFHEKLFNDLDYIINFSFESLLYGGDFKGDKRIINPKIVDMDIFLNPDVAENFKFNYLLLFFTNYVTFDRFSSNILFDYM